MEMQLRNQPADAERLVQALRQMDALINWERRSRRSGLRQSLDPMRDLMARLGSPERSFAAVHVTGTKGKGSVTTLVAAGLKRAGWRVGTYTSPHVERIHERIAIDGQAVGDDVLAAGIEAALAARAAAIAEESAAAEASWFDLLTAAAFWIFANERVEWAAVEVGLGGRLDSTNVVQGEVCVVTSIELEHTTVLGSTRTAIAREKVGILKPASSLVTAVLPNPQLGQEDAGSVLLDAARAQGTRMRWLRGSELRWPSRLNLALARLVLDELGQRGTRTRTNLTMSPALLTEEILKNLSLPGRMERFEYQGKLVVLDGAHVAASLALALSELSADPRCQGPAVGILSLGEDKDAALFLKTLRQATDTVACTYVEGSLHRPAAELCELARSAGFRAESFATPREALLWAQQEAASRWILATGSLYLAGALRPLLRQNIAAAED